MFQKAIPVWIKGRSRDLNGCCLFSAKFYMDGETRLVITANSFYKAYCNGRFIAFGPARAAHGFSRVDIHDLSDFIRPGENIVVVEAVGYNCRSFYSLDTPAFLQAEVLSGGKVVACTGIDFTGRVFEERVQKVCRFSYQRSFSESYRFGADPAEIFAEEAAGGEVVPVKGAEIIPRGVAYVSGACAVFSLEERGVFALSSRPAQPFRGRYITNKRLKIYPVRLLETFPADIVGHLLFKPEKNFENAERTKYKVDLHRGEYALFSHPVSRTGFIRIKFHARENSHILLLFDEVKKDDHPYIDFKRNDCCNIIEYEVKTGEFTHASFEPYTARFIKLVVLTGEVVGAEIEIIRYENPHADRMQFFCEDSHLTEIVEAARRTFADNAVDVLTDCPSRERGGWLCDSFFSARSEQLFTGENRVENAFLENYARSPSLDGIPEGMVPMCYPAEFEDNLFIPNWAMWYVIELYDHTCRTGSNETAAAAKEKVYGIIRYFAKFLNEFGLLEDLKGWVFVEWSGANGKDFIKGVNFPSNMLYAKMLECAGCLYDDSALLQQAASLRKTVVRFSFNGEFFEDNAVRENGRLVRKGHISETCQYYAFFTGVATRRANSILLETLFNTFTPRRDVSRIYPHICKSNAFIGDYLRLMILMRSGGREKAAEEFVQFFSGMARLTGTLWENENISGSLNHGFASYAAPLIVEYLCGFRGFRGNTVRIAKVGFVCNCKIEIPTPKGAVCFICQNGNITCALPNGYIAVYEDEISETY